MSSTPVTQRQLNRLESRIARLKSEVARLTKLLLERTADTAQARSASSGEAGGDSQVVPYTESDE